MMTTIMNQRTSGLSNRKSPAAASSSMASPSVMRSARMIGAVVATGVPVTCLTSSDLSHSPALPGVTVMLKPLRKISRLCGQRMLRTPTRCR